MYLADRDIKTLLTDLEIQGPQPEHPFDADAQVQPCSIDLRVSNVFWRPSRRRRIWRRLLLRRDRSVDLRRAHVHTLDPLRDWKRFELHEGEVVTLKPGQIVMARIYERFRVPPAYAGKIEGRSSFARLGLSVHCTGDFVNPGWEGYMPLQLFNAGPYPLRITPYLPICQLMLVPLSSMPERTYGDPELQSKYVNDDGGPSLWWRDARVKELQVRLGEVHLTERIQQDIVELVRFESPDVLERFQRYVGGLRVDQVEHASRLLEAFARREDRLRLLDGVLLASPAVLVAGLIGSLFAPFAAWHVVLAVLAVGSVLAAAAAYVRRDAGYLGGAELRRVMNRPDAPA